MTVRFGYGNIPAQVYPRNSISAEDNRRLLVQRLASSGYLSKSARLRQMFLYLCERVLDDAAEDIHEQEVGQKVFGRPADYDTSVDNIVRVHASMLRKRIEQYFAAEGQREPLIVEIPRGNYAPIFKKRPAAALPPIISTETPSETEPDTPSPAAAQTHGAVSTATFWNWRVMVPSVLVVIFAALAIFFAFRHRSDTQRSGFSFAGQPGTRQFWTQVFVPSKPTDIVLDDATLGFFQEVTGRKIGLSEYFDRSYLQSVKNSAAEVKLDPAVVDSLILKRQSSYAEVVLLEKFTALSEAAHSTSKVHFARDFSFRELKQNNVILLGKASSNPWIEPFESRLGLRWQFDRQSRAYYPVDLTAPANEQQKFRTTGEPGKPHEGYASVAFLPNMSGNGKVLIISATGGSAVSAAIDFLSDERSITQLRSKLPQSQSAEFPYFETLLKVESRSTLPRDISVVVCRPAKL